ncbi:hypothetical protein CHLRE_16g659300v5 [Chlamydomonas reinhardtii]|uniref:Uncharacterized protein n=1 Tax=Chlamydomonas reinhardtii TaxID=3055 RepID=A8J8L2_CHLRE|nr:uncharacterized protein CHLRE_16g659300v5 [Chlamydomonas reinhardtii]PNW71558.1 hypothetical protein CHLRE_16g659300v5 [Chlamydomonas reinhardtii]|eukprot:XP_001697853.1 cytochrome b5 protein [Chlamydomonas reinhardtii]
MANTAPVIPFNVLQQHASSSSCWIVITRDGQRRVYDVTNYLEHHPGGKAVIANLAGRDATREYDNTGHSKAAQRLLDRYFIGLLEPGAPLPESCHGAAGKAEKPGIFKRLFSL